MIVFHQTSMNTSPLQLGNIVALEIGNQNLYGNSVGNEIVLVMCYNN